MKRQHPSSNIQRSAKPQVPNKVIRRDDPYLRDDFTVLEFEPWNFSGAWMLELGIFQTWT